MLRLMATIVKLAALRWTRSVLRQSLRHAQPTMQQPVERQTLHSDKNLKRKMLLASTLHTLLGAFYND